MANQTAEQLRAAAQAWGAAAAKLDDVLAWQRSMVEEYTRTRERIREIEAIMRNDKEWTGEERRKVDDRFKHGTAVMERIEQAARNAEFAGQEAQRLLREALKRRPGDGTKVRARWIEFLKPYAPYIWGTITAGAAWLAAQFKYTGGH